MTILYFFSYTKLLNSHLIAGIVMHYPQVDEFWLQLLGCSEPVGFMILVVLEEEEDVLLLAFLIPGVGVSRDIIKRDACNQNKIVIRPRHEMVVRIYHNEHNEQP